ncbi:MAG: hypothetical protein LBP40_03690 [Campylobacteraceae bacterium]|jgi:hypothetical protein|nr:hypothetical protein [Campylobacteraceae bacterium]
MSAREIYRYDIKPAWKLYEIYLHNLKVDFDGYSRCGNHPNSNLAHIF